MIALGLIDVRDIEEVGTGPLMEELGLDEEIGRAVVDRVRAKRPRSSRSSRRRRRPRPTAQGAGLPSGAAPDGGHAARAWTAWRRQLAQPARQQRPRPRRRAPTAAGRRRRTGCPARWKPPKAARRRSRSHNAKSLAASGELSPEEQAMHGHRRSSRTPARTQGLRRRGRRHRRAGRRSRRTAGGGDERSRQ